MKTLASNLIKISSLILVIIFFASCRGRNNKPKNYFSIGDKTYEIKSGVIINNGETENGFNLNLRLYDEKGKNFISFTLVSPQAENLPSTTFNNIDGEWILGYNENGNFDNGYFETGKLVVNRSSDGYTIDFKCIDQYSNDIEGYYTGGLSVHKLPNYVLPTEIYDAVTKYLPVYSGSNPPDIKGEYVSAPHALIYESYAEKPNSLQFYSDRYIGFSYINKEMTFYGKQYDSLANKYVEEIQYGVKITGDNDYFTCYYLVDGYVQGYYAQQSFIFSGKKTDSGLEDFHTAVVLLETSGNPNMFAKHSFRVLKDYDGLAEKNNWLSGRSEISTVKGNNPFDIWMK